jgi:hypothetical protein
LNLQVIDKASEDYRRLEDFVQNTHAATHQQYELNVTNVSTTVTSLIPTYNYMFLLQFPVHHVIAADVTKLPNVPRTFDFCLEILLYY